MKLLPTYCNKVFIQIIKYIIKRKKYLTILKKNYIEILHHPNIYMTMLEH